jgi:predicted patatin/cPLA2 family phospholipase
MVQIDGRRFLDGALADSIPVAFFQSLGYDRNIAILTRPREYRMKKDSLLPLMKLRYRKFPRLLQAISTRHIHYNKTLEDIAAQEAAGTLLVIRPPEKLPIGRTEKDPAKLRQVYEIGRQTALARLEEIRQFLSREDN